VSRRGLRARLDPTRTRVLCGRCGQQLARVWVDFDPGDRLHRRLVFDVTWAPGDDGVWHEVARAVEAIAKGRRPERRNVGAAMGPTSPPTGYLPQNLPILAACPDRCAARQTLDAVELDVDPMPWLGPTSRRSIPVWEGRPDGGFGRFLTPGDQRQLLKFGLSDEERRAKIAPDE
jgi:hypothetical protein